MFSLLLSLFLLFAISLGVPSPSSTPAPSSPTSTPFSYLRLNFTFYGGPASYNLDFPADGNNYPTGSPFSGENIAVSLIDTNGFDAYDFCNFYGPDWQWITGLTQQSDGMLALGPPQVVTSVTCANWPGAGSSCLPEFSSCEWDSNQGGEFLLLCCGFCMATKCRSFENPP